ncbi:MAG TPA: YbaB/EbfC family nucleoid-associated protein [Ghiorsea sp.]|nr:YbaB/EbfC family nucleoid-associated protein [Ghiorsea sp.]HIP07654.1 YbaB/EbfC family nucleoid-associated protein [Mariprofundaceae bacterium]
MNIAKMMQQAKKMKDGMAQMQEELASLEVVGESGGGLVKVTVSGNHQVKRIELDDSLLADDKVMLEDLIVIAINAGMNQIEETSKAKQKDMMGGMSLPPGFSL